MTLYDDDSHAVFKLNLYSTLVVTVYLMWSWHGYEHGNWQGDTIGKLATLSVTG